MAQCFCDCGRRIGRFAMSTKSANSMGSLVEAAVAEHTRVLDAVLDELRKPGAAGGDVDALEEMRDRTIEQGAELRTMCREVVHAERAFAEVDWPALRAWVRAVQGKAHHLDKRLQQGAIGTAA